MFGHVDAGVLHVRPALDLCDKEQVKLFKQISDEVAELTIKYGGLLWGEHGKGVRSHYGEKFFTPELWHELRYIKTLFDPNNRLNQAQGERVIRQHPRDQTCHIVNCVCLIKHEIH